MSNFTWADIYAPHARELGGEALRLVADLRADYRHATALFRMQPALRMSWLKPAIDVGMVVNQGRNRRAELVRTARPVPSDRVVYFYIGRYGQDDLDWARLERLGERGIHFVGYDPAPGVGPRNLHVVPSPDWPGGDLIASTDAVGGQGRVQHGVRGDGQRHADDLPAAARVRRVPLAGPGPALLGGRRAGLVARLPGLAAGGTPWNGPWRSSPARRRSRPTAPRGSRGTSAEACRDPARGTRSV